MGNQIFISYSRKDLDFAEKLAADLKANGFQVWYDKEIRGGTDWRKSIDDNIQKANQIIVILSRHSIASKWVQHEGSMAYGQDKKIFPILINPVAADNLPIWAGNTQCVKFFNTSYEIALEQLISDMTPPDIAHEIIEREFNTYQHTKELMSADALNFIENENSSLVLSPEMDDFLNKSRHKVAKDKRTRIGIVSFAFLLFGAASVLITLGATGQLSRFIYRPLPMKMEEIPMGEFIMGSLQTDPGAEPDEIPQRSVYLDAYEIGKFEVTNRQYAQCVKAQICAPLSHTYLSDSNKEDHPVVYVKWEEANKFCNWSGYRLPTEAEWEKAARGESGNFFPWGDSAPDRSKANFDKNVGTTTETGLYSDYPSEYGVMDMAGNVWEWVADRYDADYYSYAPKSNPSGPVMGVDINYEEDGNFYVIRGGSWAYSATALRGANRANRTPDKNNENLGFCCANDSE